MAKEVRGPLEQMLSVVLPSFVPNRPTPPPRSRSLISTTSLLRGTWLRNAALRPASVIRNIDITSTAFEAYLRRIGVEAPWPSYHRRS